MKKVIIACVLVLALVAALISSCVASEPELIPREVLFGNPDKSSVQLSPDGTKISYRAPVNGVMNVWVVDIDGSNEKQLTDIPKNWEAGGWSPNGSKIVYTSWKKSSMGVGETQRIGIWIMNEDGSDRKLLTKVDTGLIEHMEWSPDGSKIAFVTWILRKDRDDRDIYVIDMPDS